MSTHQRRAVLVLIFAAVGGVIVVLLRHHDVLATLAAMGVLASGVGSILAVRARHSSSAGGGSERGPVVPLRAKCALTRAEWLAVLTDARSEFYIAGHSLGKWCDRDHHERFTIELARILHHGSVTLVILHPDSQQLPRLQKATHTDYSENVGKSLRVLEGFIGKLPVAHRGRLKISLLKDPHSLPYMLVGNEHTLITATYLASRDSDEMPCLTLERRSDAAGAIYDDFHALADLGDLFDP